MKPTPFWARLAGSAFVFAVYFGMCAAFAASGFATSAARTTAPGLVVFLAVCFGLVTIAVDSGAAYPFRELAGKIPFVGKGLYSESQTWNPVTGKMDMLPDWGILTCPMCAGMWAGTILAGLGLNVFAISDGTAAAIRDLVAHGLMGSAWCWVMHAILNRLGAYGS